MEPHSDRLGDRVGPYILGGRRGGHRESQGGTSDPHLSLLQRRLREAPHRVGSEECPTKLPLRRRVGEVGDGSVSVGDSVGGGARDEGRGAWCVYVKDVLV